MQIIVSPDYANKKFHFRNNVHRSTDAEKIRYTCPTMQAHTYSSALHLHDFYAAVDAITAIPVEGLLTIRFNDDSKVEVDGRLVVLDSNYLPSLTLALSEVQHRAVRLASLCRVRPILFHVTYVVTVEEQGQSDAGIETR